MKCFKLGNLLKRYKENELKVQLLYPDSYMFYAWLYIDVKRFHLQQQAQIMTSAYP